MTARHLLCAASLAAFVAWMAATSAAWAQRPEYWKRLEQRPSHAPQAHAQHAAPVIVRPAPPRPTYPVQPLPHPRPSPPPQNYQRHGDWSHHGYRHAAPLVYSRPIIVYPQLAYDPVVVRIVNPASTGVVMTYVVDGQECFLNPGGVQWLDHACVVTFDSGYGGVVRTVLTRGTYIFAPDAYGGWTLRRT